MAEIERSVPGPSGIQGIRRSTVHSVAESEGYDPEEPTDDAPVNYNQLVSEIKGFLYEQIETLKSNIDEKIKNNQEKFAQNLSHHLSFIDEKLSQKSRKPAFKSHFNNKHWERTQAYRTFLQDAKYHLDAGNTEEAVACIDACDEACKLYQADIEIADRSEAGWELVERLGQNQKDRDIKTIERKIIEERRAKKSKNVNEKVHNKNATERPAGSGQQYGAAKSFSPCIWCGAGNHSYKFCYTWKADVEAGKAIYDTNSRKWIRVEGYDGK